MITLCTGAIPVYLGLLSFVLPDNYSFGFWDGIFVIIPAIIFLLDSGVAKSLVIAYDWGMITCPNCQQTHDQVKDGFTSTGSQRMRCRACGQRYTPRAKPLGYPQDLRTQALKMYVDGLTFRRFARLLGVHHQTVMNWVNAAAAQIPEAPPVPAQVETVELDELYTFVKTKKKKSTS